MQVANLELTRLRKSTGRGPAGFCWNVLTPKPPQARAQGGLFCLPQKLTPFPALMSFVLFPKP